MASYDVLAARVREVTESRFKELEQQLLRGKAEAERNAAFQKKRIKRRREFLSSIGTDLKKFDAEEYRPKSVSRPSAAADAARDAAIRSRASRPLPTPWPSPPSRGGASPSVVTRRV